MYVRETRLNTHFLRDAWRWRNSRPPTGTAVTRHWPVAPWSHSRGTLVPDCRSVCTADTCADCRVSARRSPVRDKARVWRASDRRARRRAGDSGRPLVPARVSAAFWTCPSTTHWTSPDRRNCRRLGSLGEIGTWVAIVRQVDRFADRACESARSGSSPSAGLRLRTRPWRRPWSRRERDSTRVDHPARTCWCNRLSEHRAPARAPARASYDSAGDIRRWSEHSTWASSPSNRSCPP